MFTEHHSGREALEVLCLRRAFICCVLGESLHGYRICIQAVLLDRPKIATTNLGKVSWMPGGAAPPPAPGSPGAAR